MSDLVVTPFAPTLGSGRGLRTYAIVRALARHGPVELLYVPFGAAAPSPEYRAIAGLTMHEVRPSRGPRRLAAYIRARRIATAGFARGASAELTAAAAALAATPGRRRVVADGPVAAAATAGLARRRPVIYNAHNVESAFRHDAGAAGRGSRRALERFERALLAGAAESWMASRADVELARRLVPAAAVRYVPNAIDVEAIRPRWGHRGDQRALLVADFTYPPNREGLQWLAAKVLPLVWRRLPRAKLVVVGRGLEAPPRDRRIEHYGFVDDLRPCYDCADAAVVPLLHGGGSPLKFIEALAYGRPVVATPRAASGLDARPGRHFLEGSDAASFADRLVAALDGDSAAADVAVAGRALAEERYSIEALATALGP